MRQLQILSSSLNFNFAGSSGKILAPYANLVPGDRIIGTASLSEIAASKLPVASSKGSITSKINDCELLKDTSCRGVYSVEKKTVYGDPLG